MLGTGLTGCSFAHSGQRELSIWHCDTCDDFPSPAYGPSYSMMPGTYTGPSTPPSAEAGLPDASPAPANVARRQGGMPGMAPASGARARRRRLRLPALEQCRSHTDGGLSQARTERLKGSSYGKDRSYSRLWLWSSPAWARPVAFTPGHRHARSIPPEAWEPANTHPQGEPRDG